MGVISMNEVPNIISTKDLDYIKDMLKWNFVLVKKANFFMEVIADEDAKKLIEKVIKVHKSQYEKIMDILK